MSDLKGQDVAMSESKAQEDMDKEAFEQWKLRWQKNYTTPGEEMFRFKRFRESLRLKEKEEEASTNSEPPWMALDSDAAVLREIEEYLLQVCNHSGDVSSSDSDTDSEGRELRASGYHKVFLREQNEDGTFRMDTFYSNNPTHPISDVGARYYKGQSGRKKDDTKEVKRQKSGCGGCCSGSGTGT
ncbi:uncharacterized protein LOC110910355 [Helianthus annuus]|uniref:uncharacterized protein LOC110910355 n=1 Tax=Helianthus annuus TaxID=4232 RepID=UPI000B906582|nr:uncharacterized protein LOC110910355 [Helianthus annuus]